jgi:geranylgeranyl diphosphate synthase type II
MRLTMSSGAIVCGADKNEALALAGFGELLGAAYQICDDLLDELGAEDELGKPARQDHRHCRPNFAAELGAEGALRLASSLIEEGIRSLRKKFGDHPTIETLAEAASLILERAGRLTMAAA